MFYIISKSLKDEKEYIHHRGHRADLKQGFRPAFGYKTHEIARMAMDRLLKRDIKKSEALLDKHPEKIEAHNYRILQH